ncbi:SMI1/KNR4 family protein [Lysobacter sp. BMK333-48F3]|uniref:SMI1/KNR4 family protein n=1 Tax=Lysobacter sp. BMK333-48F3 TaxID=2867962 RepID=UPI001C8BBA8D|nr:SMI1/KNR4 family protein [Lysobacter sp. BMK333-48F3]MBX9401380.1 SMI1/KNR4 family protein [Lysobacter sp. BMK333-48F3]
MSKESIQERYEVCAPALRQAIDRAVQRLRDFVAETDDMSLVFAETLPIGAIAQLENKYGLALPPAYVYFLRTYGAFVVHYGGNELIGMVEPGHLHATAPDPDDAVGGDEDEVAAAIGEALFFQYIDDFSVENFWAFNPRDRRDDGELCVVAYYHDEAFALAQDSGARFRDFAAHIVDTVDDFIATYA